MQHPLNNNDDVDNWVDHSDNYKTSKSYKYNDTYDVNYNNDIQRAQSPTKSTTIANA